MIESLFSRTTSPRMSPWGKLIQLSIACLHQGSPILQPRQPNWVGNGGPMSTTQVHERFLSYQSDSRLTAQQAIQQPLAIDAVSIISIVGIIHITIINENLVPAASKRPFGEQIPDDSFHDSFKRRQCHINSFNRNNIERLFKGSASYWIHYELNSSWQSQPLRFRQYFTSASNPASKKFFTLLAGFEEKKNLTRIL